MSWYVYKCASTFTLKKITPEFYKLLHRKNPSLLLWSSDMVLNIGHRSFLLFIFDQNGAPTCKIRKIFFYGLRGREVVGPGRSKFKKFGNTIFRQQITQRFNQVEILKNLRCKAFLAIEIGQKLQTEICLILCSF